MYSSPSTSQIREALPRSMKIAWAGELPARGETAGHVTVRDLAVRDALLVLGLEYRLFCGDQLVDLAEVELGRCHGWMSPPAAALGR